MGEIIKKNIGWDAMWSSMTAHILYGFVSALELSFNPIKYRLDPKTEPANIQLNIMKGLL